MLVSHGDHINDVILEHEAVLKGYRHELTIPLVGMNGCLSCLYLFFTVLQKDAVIILHSAVSHVYIQNLEKLIKGNLESNIISMVLNINYVIIISKRED